MEKLWLSDTDMAARRGTGRTSVWRHVKQKLIPPPRKIGPRCTRWYRPEVEEWERRLIDKGEAAA